MFRFEEEQEISDVSLSNVTLLDGILGVLTAFSTLERSVILN